MIEIWRTPAHQHEPQVQRYLRVPLQWRKVRDSENRMFWAATLAEEHRSVADAFVNDAINGAPYGAFIKEVDAPTEAAVPSHHGIDLPLLRRLYDAVPPADREAYLLGRRPFLPLPDWALKTPASVREYLKNADWPEGWTLTPTPVEAGTPSKSAPLSAPKAPQAHEEEEADTPPEPESEDADSDSLEGYGTPEELEQALALIVELIETTKGGDPSPQKVAANVTRKAGLPSTTDHYGALIARAKEMISHG